MKESMMDQNTKGKLSLSWEAYQKSICNGLGLLQQRGEFVDMTIAADGHHVKVHKMVLSLVSPFIKELITSANCPHPVILLNKVSYNTLQCILQYAYTGEVVVVREGLVSFLEACKDLHIQGMQDITIQGNGKDLLHLTDARNPEDPLDLAETSQVETPSRTGIKRRRTADIEVPIEYLHSDYESHDDDETRDDDETHDYEALDDYETHYEDDETQDEGDEKHVDNETYDDKTSDYKKYDGETHGVKYSHNNGTDVEYVEIKPYKAGSRWVCRDRYYYVVQRTKGNTTYLRCASDKCPAHWKLWKNKGAGPVIDIHNHEPTPWVPNRNAMFQSLKRRCMSDRIPLIAIYEQEASRYKDAASHLPFESVAPSMRKWRRSANPATTRGLQSMG